jgi:hypothetical protein
MSTTNQEPHTGPDPGAVEQVEKLRDKLEYYGWVRGRHGGLAAALKPGERITLLSYGTVTITRPDGTRRVIYATSIPLGVVPSTNLR